MNAIVEHCFPNLLTFRSKRREEDTALLPMQDAATGLAIKWGGKVSYFISSRLAATSLSGEEHNFRYSFEDGGWGEETLRIDSALLEFACPGPAGLASFHPNLETFFVP